MYRIGTVTGNEKTSLDLTAAKGDSEFTWRRGVVGGTYLVFADTGTDGIKKVLDAADGETVNLVVHAGDASYASNTGECFAARYLFKPEVRRFVYVLTVAQRCVWIVWIQLYGEQLYRQG